jgi:ATP-dependent Zn protease
MPTVNELTITTAVHEAGHAVANAVLGLPIKGVTIKIDGRWVFGKCQSTYVAGTEFEHIVSCLAGRAAENLILGVDDPLACSKDLACANALLGKYETAPAKDLEPYRAFARFLVRTHERKIMALAKLLLQYREITPQLVERLAHDHGIH